VGRRAHANGYANHYSSLSTGGARRGARPPAPAPAPAPLLGLAGGGDSASGESGACGGECTARAWRATVDLVSLCHDKGWVLTPSGDDQFVVTMPVVTMPVMSEEATGQDEESDHHGECPAIAVGARARRVHNTISPMRAAAYPPCHSCACANTPTQKTPRGARFCGLHRHTHPHPHPDPCVHRPICARS